MTDTESKNRPVKMAGMVFTRLSSRERAITVEGRHFFCIGRDSAGWTLFEDNNSIAAVITDTHCPHCGTSKIATQPE